MLAALLEGAVEGAGQQKGDRHVRYVEVSGVEADDRPGPSRTWWCMTPFCRNQPYITNTTLQSSSNTYVTGRNAVICLM